ncbi:MAG: hypothetical protein NT154_03505 [Verrucomicrobia bacterium]|nr:hypothetical protein [Verrucomicrobiota bacterium]
MKTIVIAIGGNSLIKDARPMSVPDQYAAVVETARPIPDSSNPDRTPKSSAAGLWGDPGWLCPAVLHSVFCLRSGVALPGFLLSTFCCPLSLKGRMWVACRWLTDGFEVALMGLWVTFQGTTFLHAEPRLCPPTLDFGL